MGPKLNEMELSRSSLLWQVPMGPLRRAATKKPGPAIRSAPRGCPPPRPPPDRYAKSHHCRRRIDCKRWCAVLLGPRWSSLQRCLIGTALFLTR